METDMDAPASTQAGALAPGSRLQVVAVSTPSLGDRSYLVIDGSVALAVDPQRDIDRFVALAQERGATITAVLETHLHNDYVTGGFALARATGATYGISAADDVGFERRPLRDGDVLELGPTTRVRVLASPGHTFGHLAYVLESGESPVAVFTGGSLLYGSVGRPDLVGPEHTESLARAQHASVRRLAALPGDVAVYPTHGFGSFCSATATAGESSTIDEERRRNPALLHDEDEYVMELVSGLDDHPTYYEHMGPANAAGPSAPDLSPPPVAAPAELVARARSGEWTVVDVRDRALFAEGHLPGALGFSLEGPMATYLGWTLPWGAPIALVGEEPSQVSRAQRELVRIGIDRPVAFSVDPATRSGAGLASYRRASFSDLAGAMRSPRVVVLDVRRDREWATAHLPGALHIPLHQLSERLEEIPDTQLWVHCAGGYRASVAASILQRAGRSVVAVDDDFARAPASGLAVVNGVTGAAA